MVEERIRWAFQSTRPIRGATFLHAGLEIAVRLFQSTRPIRGATAAGRCSGICPSNFNPRAPYGARPWRPGCPGGCRRFQSTRPIRGATDSKIFLATDGLFQSTRPIRGATCSSEQAARDSLFQSTRPIRGATLGLCLAVAVIRISIHAPHTGRDATGAALEGTEAVFQSTRPIRGATAKMHNLCSAFCNNRQLKHKNQQETSSVRTFF